MSIAKTDEPIEMPSGLWTPVDTRNHVLDVGPDTAWKGAFFDGEGAAHCKI